MCIRDSNIILKNRGIVGDEAVAEFLSERPNLTFDPFLLKDMEEASERILAALDKKEKICIYGDYDADGICGVSLLYEILVKLKAEVSYYIPSRFSEGYGLNIEAIKKIKDEGTNLIITVDCGSVSYNEVELAKEIGLDVIVTDHHNLNDNISSCLLINPKQNDCKYPEKDLSGCGVAFKLVQALERKRPDLLNKNDLSQVLDLVAIATVGDIVALSGENRTMVKHGLRVINKGKRPGLAALIQKVGLKTGEIKSDHIAYIIVPHLNAAGRIDSAKSGVKLLTSNDAKEIEEVSEDLIGRNRERKNLQEAAYEEAINIIEKKHSEDKFILLYLPDAHEGITGIVAGKIKDKFARPAIVLTPTGEEKLKGTGRSLEGIDLYGMLNEFSHLLEGFGGHAGACGFTMNGNNLYDLRIALCSYAEDIYKEDPSVFSHKLSIEAELTPSCINEELILNLEKLEPYGYMNPKPVFVLMKPSVSEPFYMGERKQHVRFKADGINCVLFTEAETV